MKSRLFLVFSILMIAILALSACGPAAPAVEEEAPAEEEAAAEEPMEEEMERGGDLVIGIRASAEPASFDGQIDPYQSTWLFNSFVADSLVVLAPDGSYQPDLATEWSQSDDGLTWTFKLREDVTFHDGTPFNAEAVKYNIERIKAPETASAQAADDLGPIASVEVVDEFTVAITHESPWATMMDTIRRVALWSPTAAEEYGVAEFDKHLIGTGPFTFTEWVPNDHATFTKWEDYGGWNSVQEHEGPVYLDSVTIRFIGEDAVLGSMVETGDAHIVQELPAQYVVDYQNSDEAGFMVGYQAGTGLQQVMNTNTPPLDQLNVRQALQHATDREALNDLLYDGLYLPVYGPINSVHPCYWDGAETYYPYDPEKAMELLEGVGWVDADGDGIREASGVPGVEDGTPLDIRFTVLHHQEIGEGLQQQWREVGINVVVEVVPGPVQLDMVQRRDFELMYERQRSPDPRILHQIYHSSGAVPGGWAWTGWSDPELDAILEQIATIGDMDTRCQLAQQAQEMIMEQSPQLGTLTQPVFFAIDNDVKGFKMGTEGNWFYLNDTYIEQ